MFDITINLGNILTIAAFLVGGTSFAYSMKGSMRVLETRFTMVDAQVEDFKLEIRKLNDVIVSLAAQDGRILRIEDRQLQEGKRIDELAARVNRYVNGVVDHR